MTTMTMEQSASLLAEYTAYLAGENPRTIEAYLRVLRQFLTWLSERPGASSDFQPEQLSRTALEVYLAEQDDQGYSSSHRSRIKSAVSNFARWLIEEKALLNRKSSSRRLHPPATGSRPRELTPAQRFILRELVEKADDIRGEALFALGYWAGCRVSDVSWLRLEMPTLAPR